MTGRRLRSGVLVAYVLLLAVSWLFRQTRPEARPEPDQAWVSVARFSGPGPASGPPVTVAYQESPGPGPNVVLIHGSPMASPAMLGLHAALAPDHRVLTPDLPGFGGSSIRIPDYSVRAHGRTVAAMLDSLDIAGAHLVAYSMGGGVALEAFRADSSRIASITMLSAIGVQELELTGEYVLNRAVHGLQLAALWLVREALPHFGYLDDAVIGVPYARNFYDTDQRPLRAILEDYPKPMLILHGARDRFVPVAAAREHARIVPQSRLTVRPDIGHAWVFRDPAGAADLIAPFIDLVERGEATVRVRASPDRLAAAAEPFDASRLPPATGFAAVVLGLLIAIGTLVNEDVATIGAGLMAARGTLGFLAATAAALGGIVVGDVGLYVLGRWFGRPLVRHAPFRWLVPPERLERGEAWFRSNGLRAVFVTRFIPGTRLPTYLAAGILRAPAGRFLGYFLVAAVVWTPLLVAAAMLAGRPVLAAYDRFEAFALPVLVAVVLFLVVAARVLPLATTRRGRRMLLSRWRRITRWEFWPPWLFYVPVVAYAAFLAVRHRSATAFTAANPGIPLGGFVGESKSAILDRLDPAFVAPYRRISATEAHDAGVRSFVRDLGGFPVVVKPDVGERGRGVAIVESAEALGDALAHAAGADLVVQRYVPGVEFGVFYIRRPGLTEGELFSITRKQLIHVTGDGVRSLHDLILDDDRAVCMAPTFLARFAERLDEIPPAGERVRLVDVGTHSRGALFLDAGALATVPMREAFDAVCRHFTGFTFGRFDVRAESEAAFRLGRFQVIELNGVTSEATHIYHPGSPLLSAYRVLFTQWRTAFEIGAANRAAGAETGSIGELARAVAARRRR